MTEREPVQHSENPRERLSQRILRAVDRYTHPVSREAEDQVRLIKEVLQEGALSQTLESIEPQFRKAMRKRDQNAVIWNMFTTGVRLGLGTGFLYRSGSLFREKQWLRSTLHGVVGAWYLTSATSNPSMVGYSDRDRIQTASSKLQMYYSTEIGRNAALGQGFGESESLTSQVDRIVQAITLGDIPSVSGARPH